MNPDLRDTIRAEKERLRTQFRQYRQALSETVYGRISAEVVEKALTTPEVRRARTVHVYWPMTKRREIDTRPLIERLASQGVEIVLPVVTTFDRDEPPRMKQVRYAGSGRLKENIWGIAEPDGGEPIDRAALDAIVVPAFGAGRNGHRIGHGRGYYDGFLARVDAPRVCLVYDACLVECVPAEPHDAKMDVLVTEREILRPGGVRAVV